MFDLIGDIHGHADELTELLDLLGYCCANGVYRHPTRRAIFVGDFIDRGPQITRVLEIVRPMVEARAALAVMGNHEFNALAFHTPDPQRLGNSLRPHTDKNTHQHQATLDQLRPSQLAEYLVWFRTLPLWLDLDGLRVIHACWDDALLRIIDSAMPAGGLLTDDFLQQACDRDQALYRAVDAVLKGKEAELPDDMLFVDKDGQVRHSIRAKWYLPPNGHSYRTYALQSDPVECDLPLAKPVVQAARPYLPGEKPVFVGHYWLTAAQPAILANNVACVDYSVAKGGLLCAYRWNGEQKLDNASFVTVQSK